MAMLLSPKTDANGEIPLSSLIHDPFVRAAFERTERDQGFSFAIPPAPAPELDGGAAEEIEWEFEDVC
jgi:hypothetical protein